MNLESRICALAELGNRLKTISDGPLRSITLSNPWFNIREIDRAIANWVTWLKKERLTQWLKPYLPLEPKHVSDILVISAGNIPLVGFHDFLSVLLTGNSYIGKMSSRDNQLIPLLAEELIKIEPRFSNLICFTENPTNYSGVMATGGNNTSLFFMRSYNSFPLLIRSNRASAAYIDGSESTDDLEGLASDALNYYGLGCRSISHLFILEGKSLASFVESVANYSDILPNTMYQDNINYQKARMSLAGSPFIKTPNLLLVENPSLFSPIGVLYYSYFNSMHELEELLVSLSDQVQCIVGPGHIPYGYAQKPSLSDYADNLDTIAFLKSLHR